MGTAALGVASFGSGCAGRLGQSGGGAAPVDLDAVVARVHAGMKTIDRSHILERVAPELAAARSPAVRARIEDGEILARKTMRAMLFTGLVRDLPPAAHEADSIRTLTDSLVPEMDEAFHAQYAIVSRTSEGDHQALQQALRKDPELPMRLAAKIDLHAGRLGVGFQSRSNLRAAAAGIGLRLRRQPAAVVLDEIRSKVDRVVARHGAELERQREIVSAVTDRMVWQRRGQGPTIAGASLLGGALLTFGLATAIENVFGWTLAVLLGIAGLVCLLVGLIMMASSDPDPEPYSFENR